MRIAAFVHFYVPHRNAGSETMLHSMLKHLQKAGHEVLAIGTVMGDSPPQYEYEGIPVLATNIVYGQQAMDSFRPDVVISHHDNTRIAARYCVKRNVKYTHLVHNNLEGATRAFDYNPDLVVFNTEWLRKDMEHLVTKDSCVIHPPVWPHEHRTRAGNKITLVNLNEHKGSKILYRLAEEMPDLEFLGVVGGHGAQIVRNDIPNLEIQEHTSDMKRDVWSKTRILLMPSIYESYGMAGVEALASGIPVIANPTPGLKESQGPFGLFVDRDDFDGYKRTIREVLADYPAHRELAYKRSNELDPTRELDEWVRHVERLVL